MTIERVDGRSLRYQHRRAELLDAVLSFLLREGLDELSLRSLGKGVGVSHVTLRHHFGTKEDLLAEVFDEIRRRERVPTVMQDGDLRASIRQLWHGWTEPDGKALFRLAFEAYGLAIRHPQRYERFLSGYVAPWLGEITDLAIAAGCPSDQAATVATNVLAHIRGLQLDLLATNDRSRVDAALDAFIEGLETMKRQEQDNKESSD